MDGAEYLESRSVPPFLLPDQVSLPSHQSLLSEGWWSGDLVQSKLLPGDSQVAFIGAVSPSREKAACASVTLLCEQQGVGGSSSYFW